jgi:hypothetical protein
VWSQQGKPGIASSKIACRLFKVSKICFPKQYFVTREITCCKMYAVAEHQIIFHDQWQCKNYITMNNKEYANVVTFFVTSTTHEYNLQSSLFSSRQKCNVQWGNLWQNAYTFQIRNNGINEHTKFSGNTKDNTAGWELIVDYLIKKGRSGTACTGVRLDWTWVRDQAIPDAPRPCWQALCAPCQIMGALLLCWSSRYPPSSCS